MLVMDIEQEERNWYPKARIVETHVDGFGHVRSVKCKLADGRFFVRDVRKVVLLESLSCPADDDSS